MKRTHALTIALTLLITLTISCDRNKASSTSGNVGDGPDFSKDFNLITQFFEEQIGVSPVLDEQAKIDAYDQFRLNIIRHYEEEGVPLDFNKQRQLYQKLSGYFFSNTWAYGTVQFSGDSTRYISLNLRPESELMGHISKKDSSEFIKYYISTLKNAGDISPSLLAHMTVTLTKSYLENPSVRLLMAIHFLTINDHLNRRDPI